MSIFRFHTRVYTVRRTGVRLPLGGVSIEVAERSYTVATFCYLNPVAATGCSDGNRELGRYDKVINLSI